MCSFVAKNESHTKNDKVLRAFLIRLLMIIKSAFISACFFTKGRNGEIIGKVRSFFIWSNSV